MLIIFFVKSKLDQNINKLLNHDLLLTNTNQFRLKIVSPKFFFASMEVAQAIETSEAKNCPFKIFFRF